MDATDLAQSDKILDRSMRAVLGFATRHKYIGLSNFWGLLKGESPMSAQVKLTELAKEAAEELPKKVYQPGPAAKGITRALSVEEGEKLGQ
jgi:hypothetical protein